MFINFHSTLKKTNTEQSEHNKQAKPQQQQQQQTKKQTLGYTARHIKKNTYR